MAGTEQLKASPPSSRKSISTERIRRGNVIEVLMGLFRALEQQLAGAKKIDSQDAREVIVPCFIVYYRKYLTDARLIRLLRSQVRKGGYRIGALRFACLWVKANFASLKHAEVVAICELAQLRRESLSPTIPIEMLEALAIELNRLKLALVGASYARQLQLARSSLTVSTQVLRAVSPVLTTPTNSDSSLAASTSVSKEANMRQFMLCSSFELAAALLYINYDIFSKISPSEFFNEGWKRPDTSPMLCKFVDRCNRIANWVASIVLVQKDATLQKKAIYKLYEIASRCKQLGDYATCVSISQGFASHWVNRLRRTWRFSPERLALANDVDALATTASNYAVLRRHLTKAAEKHTTCIPHLMPYQKDLTLVEEANPDYRPDNSINMDKIVLIGSPLCELSHFQNITPEGYADFSAKRNPIVGLLINLPCRSEEELKLLSSKFKALPETSGSEPKSEDSYSTWSQDSSAGTSRNEESSSGLSDDFVDV